MEGENEVIDTSTPAPEVQETQPQTPEVAESSTDTPKEPVQLSEEDQVRKRIDKIVWQREEARREAEHWKKMANQQKPLTPTPEEATDPTRPNVNDPRFKSYDEYTEALAEWKVEQRIQKAHKEFQARSQADRRNAALKTFNERASKTREKFPEYDDLFENANVSDAMADTILESESGPEIVVYLAKNPDVANKIATLSAVAAAREIGKIEAKLDDLLQPKTISDAKPPLNPVKPKGDLPSGLDDKLPINEWMNRRNKLMGRK